MEGVRAWETTSEGKHERIGLILLALALVFLSLKASPIL